MKNDVKAYKCNECNGTGTTNGSPCMNCQGSGFIGKDSNYEYILTRNAEGQLVITDIKLPLEELNRKEEKANKESGSNKEWDSKLRGFWIMIVSTLLFLIGISTLVLYFTIFSGDTTLLTFSIICFLLLIFVNLTRLKLLDRLFDLLRSLWDEPKDFLKYFKERAKED
jgi:ABC-type multidrug transport system fused ATPase/permease subunit